MVSAEKKKRKRENYRRNRSNRLLSANTDGWTKCSDYHFQKTVGGKLINWWPSSRKCQIDNVIYRVETPEEIESLIK